MIAATRRALLLATILVVGLTAAAQADLLRYQAAIRSQANGAANFRSVVALPAPDTANPARAFAGGSFSERFQMGIDPTVAVRSLNARDGVLVGFTRIPETKNWAVDWALSVGCEDGDALIHDVAIRPRPNQFLLAGGTFEGKATFERRDLPTVELIAPPGGENRRASFIALADPESGEWIDAFLIPGMELRSMDVDDRGEIFVTGPGSLARRYSEDFQQVWDIRPPNGTSSLDHIAVSSDRENPFVYVQGTFSRQGNDLDVFVVQINKGSGDVLWNTQVNSEGGHGERAGGIGIGPLGNLRVAVSSDGADLSVANTPIRNKPDPDTDARHGHLLFLNARDGKLLNDQILGRAIVRGGVLETQNLDIDYAGNTYVSVNFTGSYQFKGLEHPGQEDAAVVVVDARGTPMRFIDSGGSAGAIGLDVAVVNRDLQVLVGTVTGTTAESFGGNQLQPSAVNKAFIAVLDAPEDQESYLITPATPDEELLPLVQLINREEGEVYRIINNPGRNIRLIAADLTTRQVNSLLQAGARVEVDRELSPDGQVIAGWALEHLNHATGPVTGTYYYPETCRETVLYLIDTGVTFSNPVLADNPNLEILQSVVVAGTGDPISSVHNNHGTEMLSMIAGHGYGVAQETPIKVVHYNIYPNGLTSTMSALIEAIDSAANDKNQHHLYDPAVFCIASSSDSPDPLPGSLETAIDYALGSNVYATVLVSAGNTDSASPEDAKDYPISSLGSKDGVLCVGAIKPDNSQSGGTRGSPGVDLWAPGTVVAAGEDVDGVAVSMSGTSASTALATGAALIYLSANPFLTPAHAEAAITLSAQWEAGKQIVYVPESYTSSALNHMTTYADWAFWHDLDDDGEDNGTDTDADGDGWTDKEEYFFLGSNPNSDPAGQPSRDPFDSGSGIGYRNSILASVGNKQHEVTFEFPLSCILLDEEKLADLQNGNATDLELQLRDGSSLVIQRTVDPADPGSWETWLDMNKLEIYALGPDTAIMQFTVDLPSAVDDFYLYRVHVDPNP